MKIGILTWFRNTNYGGCLQGLALMRYLSSLGHDVRMINYSPRQSLRPMAFSIRRFIPKGLRPCAIRPVVREIVAALLPLFPACDTEKRRNHCVAFLRKYFGKIGASIESRSELYEEIKKRFDAVVVGSDQIWNPDWIDEGSYLLAGLNPDVKRIAYAPSVGRVSIPEHLEKLYREALAGFSALSLRERAGVEALRYLSDKPMEWVVDPTLLLSADEWLKTLNLPNEVTKDGPLVCYWLSTQEGMWKSLTALARRHQRKVLLFMDAGLPLMGGEKISGGRLRRCLALAWIRLRFALNRHIVLCEDRDARSFVAAISTASGVITDSYHALIFSTIFHRNVRFIVSKGREGMKSRALDFIDHVGMRDVLCSEIDSNMFSDNARTSYNESALSEWIGKSKAWIDKSLEVQA